MAKAPVNFNTLLDQVNKIRMALAIGEGKLQELPKGKQSSSVQCVLARALSNGWKARVSSHIQITHSLPLPENVNLEKVAQTLRGYGFKGVEIIDGSCYTRFSRHFRKPAGVSFRATPTMDNFIDRFDNGDFPHLILERK